MSRQKYAIAGGVFFIFAIALAFLSGTTQSIRDDIGENCEVHPARHHRPKPRPIARELKRRACAFLARSVNGTGRLADFNYALVEAEAMQLPAIVDSNSPAVWQDGSLHIFNSSLEEVFRSQGEGVSNLSESLPVHLPDTGRPGGIWIESVWLDQETKTLYGWYHFEPADVDCQTAPLIGAAVSTDGGLSWHDRGIVISSAFGLNCDYENGYFAGGNGDFSVVMGPERRYFYFMFTNYAGPRGQQGIGLARGLVSERGQPGTVQKYYEGTWTQPGVEGVFTPIFGTSTGWKGPFVESYWGPSVHWNTYLKGYILLMNHTQGTDWEQEGVYISYSKDLVRWTEPSKLLTTNDWYPQVMGLGPSESDSVAGREARIFVGGISTYIIQFEAPTARSAEGLSAVQEAAP